MYETFYGLKEKTFNLSPDPEYFFMSKGHERVFKHLEYAISENKGFAVVTGEIGSGKTTLINYLLYKIKLDIHIGLINNTNIPASQFLKVVCSEFEIENDSQNKIDLMENFQNFLLKQYGANNQVVLIIDEAQNLSSKIIEEIRMISNLEDQKSHLIQMILVGQPELKYKLKQDELKQFAQRVSVYSHLKGLTRNEVGEYIRYRLKMGRAKDIDLFDKNSIDLIHEYSDGIPRIINIICDTALVYGYADGLKKITRDVIKEVINEREQSGIFKHLTKPDLSHSDAHASKISATGQTLPDSNVLNLRINQLEATLTRLQGEVDTLKNQRNDRDLINVSLLEMLEKNMKKRMQLIALVQKISGSKNEREKVDIEDQLLKITMVK